MAMHGFQDRGAYVPRGRFTETGRFGRMFPYLRTLYSFEPGPEALGRVGGRMDGGSPPPSDTTQDNPRIRAGYTFLGQFIDHDVTFDPTSVLEQQIDPQATKNFRTPALELDSLYGLGRGPQPYLYDQDAPGKFLLGGTDGDDLPRNSQGRALIGDPRNDENVLVSQLHLLFLKFHNKVFDTCTDESQPPDERFQTAQTLVRWHYQWLVVNEFLGRLVGADVIGRAIDDMPFRFEHEAYMPVEFSVAAFRFGHSQVRPGYLLSDPASPPPPRGALMFPDLPDAAVGVGDLRGGRPIPDQLQVDWAAFFGDAAQASKLIDPRISTTLLRLPFSVVGRQPGEPDTAGDDRPMIRSLATRNLQRGIDARLPSGQAVARHLCLPEIPDDELWDGVDGGTGPAPLWFYLLREAELQTDGHMLSGVGAQIVARVFAAMLEADKASYLVQDPYWEPTLGSEPGRFTMSDLVNFTLGTELGQEPAVADLPAGRTITLPTQTTAADAYARVGRGRTEPRPV
jgi:hypothetical protein